MHISAKTLFKKLAQSFLLLSFSFQAISAAVNPGIVSITVDGVEYKVYAQNLTVLENGVPSEDFIAQLKSTSWYGSDIRDDIANAYIEASDSYEPMQLYWNAWTNYDNVGPFVVNNIFGNNDSEFTAAASVTSASVQNGGPLVGFYNTFQNWFTASNDSLWFLLQAFGPSADDTLASMQPNASATKNAFNSQYATLAYGLNHDCTVFDSKGICMSLFGRNTSVNDSAFDSNAAGVVLAYKPHSQFRVGTYVDQSLNSNTMAGVNVERSNPDFGIFGVWNKNTNGQGLAIRAAANYGSRDFNVSRTAIGTAEAGVGKTDLDAYGALLEASYAYPINDAWTAKPYAALRYLSIQRDGYTETNAIDNPLSYSGLEQQTTSALVGLRFTGYLTPKVTTAVNVGVEHDLHHGIDNYRATGVDSLGFVNMDNQTDRTRPTAGARLSYAVAEQQFISAAVQYRKEIFMSESSVTGQVNYTIGF